MGNKYGAKKVTAPDGQVFDSKREYHRYCELKLLERAGKIRDLRRQIKYVLIPSQHEGQYKELLERECSYIADFVYIDVDSGKEVVEDVKGYKRGAAYQLFSIKRKLMLFKFGIRVLEV